jgi:hypothetical protein
MNGPTAWNIWGAQAGLDGLLKKDTKLGGTGEVRVDLGGVMEMCEEANVIKMHCMKVSRIRYITNSAGLQLFTLELHQTFKEEPAWMLSIPDNRK